MHSPSRTCWPVVCTNPCGRYAAPAPTGGSLRTALANLRNTGEAQGTERALRTAIMPPNELGSSDFAHWRTLATHRRLSGPFVDPHWVLSWTEAFAPNEPMLIGAWDGRR